MASQPARRLLVVDDDADLRELFETYMKSEGFEVASAEDGVKGLAKASDFRPHLIVLDLMMPNLSGFEVIHKLQDTDLRDVPVIVVTGYSDVSNEQLVRQERNVAGFVAKPLRYADLAVLIRKTLGPG